MKCSLSVLILAIIGTLYAPAMDSAESRSVPPIKDFLIDPSKPYVYLETDHIGPRKPGNEHEPNTGIYLRLKNNCRLPIIVSTFGGPIGGTDGEVGVMDEVVLNPTAIYGDMDGTGGDSKPVPLLLNTPDELLSPEMKRAKVRLQAVEQEKAKTESAQENARQVRRRICNHNSARHGCLFQRSSQPREQEMAFSNLFSLRLEATGTNPTAV
jgi:hypothetical protein